TTVIVGHVERLHAVDLYRFNGGFDVGDRRIDGVVDGDRQRARGAVVVVGGECSGCAESRLLGQDDADVVELRTGLGGSNVDVVLARGAIVPGHAGLRRQGSLAVAGHFGAGRKPRRSAQQFVVDQLDANAVVGGSGFLGPQQNVVVERRRGDDG